jgi:hemin uptake protein HemP
MNDGKCGTGGANPKASVDGPPARALGGGRADEAVSSESLLRGKGQIAIRHKNETYILRQTRFGKLILTK